MFFQVFPGLRRKDSLSHIVFRICSFRYRKLLRISIRELAARAGVPLQYFANRSDKVGGSTLGNLQSHTLPIPMADIGCAQFAMHSAVETASVADAEAMTKAVAAFYRVHLRALGDGTYTLE